MLVKFQVEVQMTKITVFLTTMTLAIAIGSHWSISQAQGRTSASSMSLPFGLQRFGFTVQRNIVAATGSWIADSPGPMADSPVQTSDLTCFHDRQECVEARAFLNEPTNHLIVMTVFYEIKEWSDTEVVAESSLGPQGNAIQIRFDLVRRVVRMTESRLPPDAQRSAHSRYDAHLDDGDKVKRQNRK